MAAALHEAAPPGVAYRPAWFVPTASKHAGQLCGGVQLHVTEGRAFRPLPAALHLLTIARRFFPTQFAWRSGDAVPWIDRLSGSDALRRCIEAETPVPDIVASWRPGLRAYREERRPPLHY